jgi:hypothetical protein
MKLSRFGFQSYLCHLLLCYIGQVPQFSQMQTGTDHGNPLNELKIKLVAGHQWITSVILATWEIGLGRL